jgi:hypothetical protein
MDQHILGKPLNPLSIEISGVAPKGNVVAGTWGNPPPGRQHLEMAHVRATPAAADICPQSMSGFINMTHSGFQKVSTSNGMPWQIPAPRRPGPELVTNCPGLGHPFHARGLEVVADRSRMTSARVAPLLNQQVGAHAAGNGSTQCPLWALDAPGRGLLAGVRPDGRRMITDPLAACASLSPS